MARNDNSAHERDPLPKRPGESSPVGRCSASHPQHRFTGCRARSPGEGIRGRAKVFKSGIVDQKIVRSIEECAKPVHIERATGDTHKIVGPRAEVPDSCPSGSCNNGVPGFVSILPGLAARNDVANRRLFPFPDSAESFDNGPVLGRLLPCYCRRLPLAAPATTRERAFGLNTIRRGGNNGDQVRPRVPGVDFSHPRKNAVSRNRARHEYGQSGKTPEGRVAIRLVVDFQLNDIPD